MSLFIGVKLIKAEAMTRAEYNDYRNWLMRMAARRRMRRGLSGRVHGRRQKQRAWT